MQNQEEIVPIEHANSLGFCSLSKQAHNFDFISFKFNPLKEDEIRIKILFTGVCQYDILCANGTWDKLVNIEMPCVPGHEIIGEIIKKGDGVKDLYVGDIVGFGLFSQSCKNCIFCLKGEEILCKNLKIIFDEKFGGWATHFQGKAINSVKIPKGIPLEQAPPLLCAGLSIFPPMKKYLSRGMKVVVIGVGELGHLAIKFAKHFGCIVYALTSTSENIKDLKDQGADKVLTTNNLKEVQNTKDIDIIFSCVGEGPFDEYIQMLRKGGTLVFLNPANNELKIDLNYLVFNQIKIEGSFMGTHDDLKNCLDFCAKHKNFPNVEIFYFDDFPKVVHKIHYEKPKYRCIVKCQSKNYPYFND